MPRLRRGLTDGSRADLAQKHGFALIVLFGSAADPTETSPGDLDLAVAWRSGAGDHDIVGVTSDLLALLGDDVDVLDLDRGGPVVRQRALTQGQVLLELEAGAFATHQMRAIRDYIDTAYLRRRQFELLTGSRP